MLDARKTKDDNRRRHTREGLEKPLAERKSEFESTCEEEGGFLFCWGLFGCSSIRHFFHSEMKVEMELEAYLRLGFLFSRRGHGCRATLAGTWVVLFVFMSPVTVLFTVTYSLYPHITQYEYALYDILQSN
jgi:hypothetical protein